MMNGSAIASRPRIATAFMSVVLILLGVAAPFASARSHQDQTKSSAAAEEQQPPAAQQPAAAVPQPT